MTLNDPEIDRVVRHLQNLDPSGERFGNVFRETFDQLYDGQRTGRYRWDQLYKTEKTHYGTLIEINLQREFSFADGDVLDYKIDGIEIDCKYSFKDGGWMLPPECWGQLILVSTASDELSSWSLGVVRVSDVNRRASVNRDGKTSLSPQGREAITWIFRHTSMPPNVLLHLSDSSIEAIYSKRRGQARLDELFRQALEVRIHRSSVATVAQQQDYMKRVRYNRGSRSNLRDEGILILGGDFSIQRELAEQFAVPVPKAGELVSLRVVPTEEAIGVQIDGRLWRKARHDERVVEPAPILPGQA